MIHQDNGQDDVTLAAGSDPHQLGEDEEAVHRRQDGRQLSHVLQHERAYGGGRPRAQRMLVALSLSPTRNQVKFKSSEIIFK